MKKGLHTMVFYPTLTNFWIALILKSECYKELYYRPHSGTRFRRFGPFWPGGQNGKISETTEFLLKYATFLGGFFNFLWAKLLFRFFLKVF